MNRDDGLARLRRESFDVLIIGGGASGLGCALDAASRGYRTGLVEGNDFAGATSSRSTKLVHGGVRYLRQGNVALVRQALQERGRLLRNAPEIVTPLEFFVPARTWWERAYYAAGLRLYDLLAGERDVPRSRRDREGVRYWDAQFDDARLAIALAQTAVDQGAAIVNYVRAAALLKRAGRICGIRVADQETGESFEVPARVVINAGGIFCDEIRRLDDPSAKPLVTFARGSHLVVGSDRILSDTSALLIPRTQDGRVLFVIPWHGAALIGTTDVPATGVELEPRPSADEVQYLLRTVNRHIAQPLCAADVTSAFAGLRPLLRGNTTMTARLSREHHVECSASGLVTLAGGKWTTYRLMAQDAVDAAIATAALSNAPCRTHTLRLRTIPPVPELDYAIRHEMARTVSDLLSRRRRTLLLDARAAAAQAADAASLLAYALSRPPEWEQQAAQGFVALASRYTVA